jgi:predicted DNA-binding transcriptional regulator AlpA
MVNVQIRWLRTHEVRARFRIGKTTLWDWVAKGLLPKPHHIGRIAVWPVESIERAEARLVQPPGGAQ